MGRGFRVLQFSFMGCFRVWVQRIFGNAQDLCLYSSNRMALPDLMKVSQFLIYSCTIPAWSGFRGLDFMV